MMNLNLLRRVNGFSRNAKLFLLNTVLFGLGISLLVLLYNLYILSLGFHEDMIGLVTAVASVVAVAAAIPMGLVANRLGYKWGQVAGIVGSALSIALALLIPTGTALIVTEFIWGVAFTLAIIIGAPFIAENSSEEERPYLFSIQFAVVMLTAFIGSLGGGQLPRAFANWLHVAPESPAAYQGALAIGVLLMLASAVPLLFLETPRAQGAHAHIARPRLTVHDRGRVARLLLPSLVGAVGGGMFIPFTNVFWRVLFNLGDDHIGQVFAASALLVAGLGMLAPALTRRWGLVRVMVVTQLLSVAGLITFGFSPWLVLALAGYLGRDVLINLSRPLGGQFLMERCAVEERAAVSALSTMVFNLSWGVGSWVSGMWQAQGQFALVFGASAGFYLVSVVLLQLLFGERRAARESLPAGVTVPVGSPAE
jgi:MFS family permease